MVIHDNELNLSLEEFQYFQECPQKFRLYRILNPLPDKETFLKKKRPIKEYELRNFSEDEMNGIKYHHFFSTFHLNYEYSIKRNSLPPELLTKPVYSLFWKYQQQRYKESLENYSWYPLVTEFNIMNKSQRGIIDCVEFINNDEELRIIDYKKNKHKNDLESLYFYAFLLDDYLIEMNWDGLTIKEIGCYYYLNGELNIEEYNFTIKNKITKKLNEIKKENFILKKENCERCDLQIVCKIQNQNCR